MNDPAGIPGRVRASLRAFSPISCWRRLAPIALGAGLWTMLLALLATSRHEAIRRFAFVDFYDYYFAGAAMLTGRSPYDSAWAEAAATAAGVATLAGSDFIYPPWFAVAMIPWSLLPARGAAIAWFATSAAALLGSASMLQPEGGRRWGTWLLVMLFPPALFTLWVGQVNALILLLLVMAWRYRDEAPRGAGVALGAAASVKLFPAMLLIPLVARGRTRMSVSALATLACAGLAGELLVQGGTGRYVQVLIASSGSDYARLAHPVNQGVWGFLSRLLTDNDWARPIWSAPGLLPWVGGALCASIVAWVAWASCRTRHPEAASWAAAVAGQVVISPLAWESSQLVLVLPIALLASRVSWPWIAAAIGLIAAQRALDPTAALLSPASETLRWLRLASPGLLGTMVLLVAATQAHRVERRSRADGFSR